MNQEEEVYNRLAARYNENAIGAPLTREFINILKLLFEPAEAELAAQLPTRNTDVNEIAQGLGREKKELQTILDNLAHRGLVYRSGEGQNPRYRLLPTLYGIFQTAFWPGHDDSLTRKLGTQWTRYLKKEWGEEVMGEKAGVPNMRVLPINMAVASPGSLVIPFEIAEEMIDRTEFQSVANCPCRMSKRMAYEGCDYPLEVCLHFGWVARYQIEQNLAKKISKKEAVEILQFAEEQGLVHLADNHAGELSSICNCCSCCCMFIQGMTSFDLPNALARANYFMEIDQEKCQRCGLCAERCPVGAITYTKKEVPVVDTDRCIGCGVCRPTCPTDAAMLIRKKEDQMEPLLSSKEAAKIMLSSRGRI